MTPEGRVEAYLKKRVKETGGEFRKLKWIARNGAPDRMVWWAPNAVWVTHIPEFKCDSVPRFGFIEVKRPGAKPTDQQLREHQRLRNAGFQVFVVDDEASVDAAIDRLAHLYGNAPMRSGNQSEGAP